MCRIHGHQLVVKGGMGVVFTKLTRQIDKYLIIGNNRLFGYNISTGKLVREGIGFVLLPEASVVVPLANMASIMQYNAPDSQVLPVAVSVREDV